MPSAFHLAWRYPPCFCSPTGTARNFGIAHGLARRGWTITVITRRPTRKPCPCWADTAIDFATSARTTQYDTGSVTVEYVSTHPSRRARWYEAASDQSLTGRLVRKPLGLALVLLDDPSDFVQQGRKRMAELAAASRPDIIIVSPRPIAAIDMVQRLTSRIGSKSVVDLHDSIVRMARDRGHRLLRKPSLHRALRALHRADLVVGISPEEAQRDEVAARRSIALLSGGFDREFWQTIETDLEPGTSVATFDDTTENKFRIVYTGRLYAFQNPMIALSALRLMADRVGEVGSDSQLALCLFGVESAYWEQAAREAGVEWAVHRFGHVDRTRASIALKRSHVGILLGRTDHLAGNFGQKLFDYIASGIPILFSPGDRSDSGAQVIDESGAGTTTRSIEEAAAFLESRFREWERRGRGDPAHATMRSESRREWAFEQRVAEFDTLLTDLLAQPSR